MLCDRPLLPAAPWAAKLGKPTGRVGKLGGDQTEHLAAGCKVNQPQLHRLIPKLGAGSRRAARSRQLRDGVRKHRTVIGSGQPEQGPILCWSAPIQAGIECDGGAGSTLTRDVTGVGGAQPHPPADQSRLPVPCGLGAVTCGKVGSSRGIRRIQGPRPAGLEPTV